jgi:hypothetical protein
MFYYPNTGDNWQRVRSFKERREKRMFRRMGRAAFNLVPIK